MLKYLEKVTDAAFWVMDVFSRLVSPGDSQGIF